MQIPFYPQACPSTSFATQFWSGGFLKVIGDTAQVTSPLVVKAIINFATASYADHIAGDASLIPAIGTGIGLSFCLFFLQIIASLCTHHFFYRSTSTGVLLRGGLITAIYNRSLKLTAKARGTLTNGKLVNHISTDVSRIDFCCGFFHMSWTALIQMTICLILLLLNLGEMQLVYSLSLLIICRRLCAGRFRLSDNPHSYADSDHETSFVSYLCSAEWSVLFICI